MSCFGPTNIIMKSGIKWALVDWFEYLDDKLDMKEILPENFHDKT